MSELMGDERTRLPREAPVTIITLLAIVEAMSLESVFGTLLEPSLVDIAVNCWEQNDVGSLSFVDLFWHWTQLKRPSAVNILYARYHLIPRLCVTNHAISLIHLRNPLHYVSHYALVSECTCFLEGLIEFVNWSRSIELARLRFDFTSNPLLN
jgi:hypothetical protein